MFAVSRCLPPHLLAANTSHHTPSMRISLELAVIEVCLVLRLSDRILSHLFVSETQLSVSNITRSSSCQNRDARQTFTASSPNRGVRLKGGVEHECKSKWRLMRVAAGRTDRSRLLGMYHAGQHKYDQILYIAMSHSVCHIAATYHSLDVLAESPQTLALHQITAKIYHSSS
jgi:hypothetical protein